MIHRVTSELVPEAVWFKSSYSQENGTNCVEVADLARTAQVGVRDSKIRTGPVLIVPVSAWAAFVSDARAFAPRG
ncbi:MULTISPECIES: DUF397 domain-containing protein [unclassified Streptomyces]|uniref:DUF397 domain-containing protein n=1 Tax=unclassified Streptomyces TaxID=2593676 RepID=UPI0037F8EEDD